MKARKLITAGAIVATAALLLAGCSASQGTSSTSSTGSLNFAEDKGWKYEPLSTLATKEIGVSLKTTSYTNNQTAFQALIKQSLRTPKAPDIFTWHTGTQLEALVDQGLIADTSSIWKEAVSKGYISQAIEDMYTIKGKQYCVPLEVDYWGMYYNKADFTKAGITSTPTTWTELMSDAAKLKAAGITPFYSQGGDPWAFIWYMLIMTGTDLSKYNDINAGKASYTDPEVVKAMDTWATMIKEGYFSDPGAKAPSSNDFKANTSAMQTFGTWYPGSLSLVGLTAGKDYGLFPVPAVDSSAGKTPVAVETAPVCVTEKSANKARGLKYSQWLMTPNAQSTWSKAQGILPYNPQATAANATLGDFGKEVTSDKYQAYLRYYEAAPAPVLTAALNNFTGFMLNPGSGSEKYLSTIQAASKTYWDSKK